MIRKAPYGRIHSPGNSPYAITVGASNTLGTDNRSDDVIASFSSRGPTRSFYTSSSTGEKIYDNVIKPDMVAPGNKLVSSKSRIAINLSRARAQNMDFSAQLLRIAQVVK